MRKRPQYGRRKTIDSNGKIKKDGKRKTKSFLIISQKAEALGMCKKGFFSSSSHCVFVSLVTTKFNAADAAMK